MPRARWFVVGYLLVAAVVGGVLNERGPFGAHPALAYDQFLADFQAGKVERIVQWRDQLEVTEQGAMHSVVVPLERDLQADLGQARRASGVGISYTRLADQWLGLMTPWVPFLIAVAAILIWATAIARIRRSGFSSAQRLHPAG
jgi:hypothetical protein